VLNVFFFLLLRPQALRRDRRSPPRRPGSPLLRFSVSSLSSCWTCLWNVLCCYHGTWAHLLAVALSYCMLTRINLSLLSSGRQQFLPLPSRYPSYSKFPPETVLRAPFSWVPLFRYPHVPGYQACPLFSLKFISRDAPIASFFHFAP